MSRRKKETSSEGLTGNEWINTYADTITLVLTFFILLYSFSSVDANKFKGIANALQSVLQGNSGDAIFDYNMSNGNVPMVGDSEPMPNSSGGVQEDLYNKLKEIIEKNNLQATVEIKKDTKGVNIELRDNVLFDSGKADIKDGSKPILDKISAIISSVPYNIEIEGHTDNIPISNFKYESNWELSTSRAVNVVKYFIETKGLNPIRFTAAGYGEYKPLAPNDTDEHRAHNRRVNIIILAKEKEIVK